MVEKMRQPYHYWFIPALAVGLAVIGLYAYNENARRSAAVFQLENTYQGAFHGLAYHVDEMQDALGRALAASKPAVKARELQMADRFAEAARGDASRLPAAFYPTGSLQAYLGAVSDRTSYAVEGLASGRSISKEEGDQLQALLHSGTLLDAKLRAVQNESLNNRYRFSPAGVVFEDRAWSKNPVYLRMKQLDRSAAAFVGNLPGFHSKSFASAGTRTGPQKQVDAAEAAKIARRFLSVSSDRQTVVQKLGPGAEIPGYVATVYQKRGDAEPAFVTVSGSSGEVLWMTRPATNPGAGVDFSRAGALAERFLRDRLHQGFALIEATQSGEHGDYRFVPLRSGAILYNYPVFVKVNLKNGQVVGYDAAQYLNRPLPSVSLRPTLSVARARNLLAPGFQTDGARLAVVDSVLGQPTLAYDFLGRLNGATYRVFVNAKSGTEIGVQKLSKEDAAAGVAQ